MVSRTLTEAGASGEGGHELLHALAHEHGQLMFAPARLIKVQVMTLAGAVDAIGHSGAAGTVHLPGAGAALKHTPVFDQGDGTTEPLVERGVEGTAGLGFSLEERLGKGEGGHYATSIWRLV